MRFLKLKIAKAQESVLKNQKAQALNIKIEPQQDIVPVKIEAVDNTVLNTLKETTPKTVARKTSNKSTSKPQSPLSDKSQRGSTSAKNIIKNYGRVLANFAASDLALPYLIKLAEQENIEPKEFRKFIASKTKQARCIKGLRDLLLVNEKDDNVAVAYKRIFRELAIIFMKFFSVNWIFGGKLCDKKIHLKYRFKILRRIQNPEFFTYLKGFA